MRILIALVVLGIAGLAAAVVFSEQGRREQRLAQAGPVQDPRAPVLTISEGEEVDLGQWIPREGRVVVEFSADF